ncbi:MAG: NAD(P)/FAD-dependent oxidoreductase [Spirochaeta sp.]
MIILVGAGHTHIEILRRGRELQQQGHEAVCISPAPLHPYSGMGPGVLGGRYRPEETLLPAAELAQRNGIRFIQDRVTGVDTAARTIQLAAGQELRYTLLSLNIGSESEGVPAPGVFSAKPISELFRARREIESRAAAGLRTRIAVVGGGPSGVELAGNAACLLQQLRAEGGVVLYSADANRLAGVSGRRFRYIVRRLRVQGVDIRFGVRADIHQLDADIILAAGGVRPPQISKAFGLPAAADGSFLVDEYLRVQGFTDIFAVGDCAWFAHPESGRPLDRVGVYAVRQQEVLMENLLATASVGPGGSSAEPGPARAPTLTPFTGVGRYLSGVNLGCGRGMLYRGCWTVTGRPAFRLKDWIDRRFVRRYYRD